MKFIKPTNNTLTQTQQDKLNDIFTNKDKYPHCYHNCINKNSKRQGLPRYEYISKLIFCSRKTVKNYYIETERDKMNKLCKHNGKEYRKKNKDKIKKYKKEYNKKNKDKIRKYNKEYKKKNKDKINKLQKEYRKKKKQED